MVRKTLVLVGLAALLAAPLARADGDPASDVLLAQNLFLPPDVPTASAVPLDAVVRDAKAHGYPIRVALIGSTYDLGSVGVLFRQPKQYARFLGTELSLVYKGRLLVVMPNGLAVSQRGKLLPADQAVVDRLPAPGASGAAIAAAATRAVIRLAARKGVTVAVPPAAPAPRAENQNRDRLLIVLITLVAVGGFVAFGFARRRWRARVADS